MVTKIKSFYATGRRKTAVARVWLFPNQKGRAVNGKSPDQYLKRPVLNEMIESPLKVTQLEDRFRVRVRVHGGGIAGQAGAIKLGVARALLLYDESLKQVLRKNGLLTRDPRKKERKKFGRKGARKSFQFTKR